MQQITYSNFITLRFFIIVDYNIALLTAISMHCAKHCVLHGVYLHQ